MARVLLLVVSVFGAFALLQEPVRRLETMVAGYVTGVLPGPPVYVYDTWIVLRPPDGAYIRAALSPSCSALAAVLALVAVGVVAPRASLGRKVLAIGVAVGAVVLGNFARLVGSLVAGNLIGRSGLVAFHDVVGSMMTFLFVIGGYVLMLMVLLPRERRPATLEAPLPVTRGPVHAR